MAAWETVRHTVPSVYSVLMLTLNLEASAKGALMPGRVAGPTPDTALPRPGPLGPGPCSVCSRALRPRSATQKTGAASPLCTSGPQSAPEATSPFAAASAHTPPSACAHRRAHGNVSYAVGRETECVDRLRLSGPHPPSGSVNRRPPPHREGGAPEGQRVHVCVPRGQQG